MTIKRLFRFAGDEVEGDASMLALLGGKGANLAEMASMGIPVPPGFTIATDACKDYQGMAADRTLFMGKLMDEVLDHCSWLYGKLGYAPLVSVRSGAPVSMPGMMDTILNVGLCSGTMGAWQDRIGERAKLDSYRRLIQMLGSTAYGVDMAKFDFQLASVKKAHGVTEDTALDCGALTKLIDRYLEVFRQTTGLDFPDTPAAQLAAAIEAVFRSWMNPRAIEYRRIHKIDEAMGTAVTVQAMVFGNMGEDCGTGVLFSRNPSTGANEVLGEFLPNAQGEDVVAGIRTPLPLSAMKKMLEPKTYEQHSHDTAQLTPVWPNIALDLEAVTERLEQHYRDMMDIEFTVQGGKLYLLQCRVGKRSALAAFRIAAQFVDEGVIEPDEAVKRVSAAQYALVRRPRIPDSFKTPPLLVGQGASPGVAVGRPVFSSADAVNCKEPCILVTHETNPDDIAGMNKAQGILTATGGATSHAAVVARAMDKPCVVGCTELVLHPNGVSYGVHGGDFYGQEHRITICGDTGRVWAGVDVPVEDVSADKDVLRMSLWALEASGFSEQVAWPQPDSKRLQTIALAGLWGDHARYVELLYAIKAAGTAGHTVLDATLPHDLFQEDDALLRQCFGTPAIDSAWGVGALGVLLQPVWAGLSGLTVLCPAMESPLASALREAGFKVASVPKTLHDLLFSERIVMTDAFVANVAGSKIALDALFDALAKAGKPTGVLRRAVPLEYATYAALG